MGFVKTGSTTSKDLEEILLSLICGLSLSSGIYLVAQGYDSAAYLGFSYQSEKIYSSCILFPLSMSSFKISA